MTALFRILGMCARMTESLGRKSINFIPLHIILLIVCGTGAAVSGSILREIFKNSSEPRRISVADIHEGTVEEGTYVTLEGLLFVEGGYEKREKGKYDTEEKIVSAYNPLIDPQARKAVMVEMQDPRGAHTTGPLSVTGMLRRLPPDLAGEISLHGRKILEGVPVSTALSVRQGDRPGSPGAWIMIGLVSAALFAGMIVSMILEYTIFQKTAGSLQGAFSSVDRLNLRATGNFVLEGRSRKHFTAMPAGMGKMPDGSFQIYSNIDASSRFMGFKTADRAGLWNITIPASAVRSCENGRLYWGSAVYPSLRVRYADASGSKKAVLSFENENEKLYFINELRTAGFPFM